MQPLIGAILGKQLFVSALLDDAASLKHHDEVHLLNRGKAMGDHQQGSSLRHLLDGSLKDIFTDRVEACGRLIQDENLRVEGHRTCKRKKLSFAEGQRSSSFRKLCLVTVRETTDEIIRADETTGFHDRAFGNFRSKETDVVDNAARKQHHVLLDNTHVVPKDFQRDFPNIVAVESDGAMGHVVESCENIHQ